MGKVAMVTGASRGIGRGIAIRLVDEGARVIINGRDRGQLEETRIALQLRGGQVLAVAGDVGLRADAERLFEEATQVFGGVDLLVNNAAWANPTAHFLELDEVHWDQVMRTNLKSVYLCSHLAANLMVDQGRRGSLINISSFGALRAHRSMAAYDASKGGIEAFTRTVALDLAPFGIRVNAVAPGPIETETTQAGGPEAAARRASAVPLGRVGLPADVAGAVAFLASDDAAFITGQCLYVDGGMLAQLRPPALDTPVPPTAASRLHRAGEDTGAGD